MRIDHGLAIDLLSLHHLKKLYCMIEVTHSCNVCAGVNLVLRDQSENLSNIPGRASTRTGHIYFFILHDPGIKANEVLSLLESAKQVQDGAARNKFLRRFDCLFRTHRDDDIVSALPI